MYGLYTETLHTNHLRRVDLSSHLTDLFAFLHFITERKKLPVDINAVEIELGI